MSYKTDLQSNNADLQAILAKVNSLPDAGGVELPELSNEGSSGDLLSGKQLIDGEGNVVTGTIETKTASDLTASGATVMVPAGYYASQAMKSVATATRAETTMSVTADDTNDILTITASNNQNTGYVTGANKTATKTISLTASGATVSASDGTNSVSKSVATATQATPSVSVDSSGLITASSTQTAGYVSAGTKSGTKQLTTQAAQTITPSKSSQTAVASGVYTTGAVTVAAIPNQYITTTDATASADEIISGETAYVNGSKVTGTFTIDAELNTQDDLIAQIQAAVDSLPEAGSGEPNLQDKTVTPSTSSQNVMPDSGYDGLSKVTVNAIPNTYVKPASTKAATTYTPTTTNQTIVAGTYCSGAQTIKGDSNLVTGNIKSGVSIFGVTGSYEGSSGGSGSGGGAIETYTVQIKSGDSPVPELPIFYYTDVNFASQSLSSSGGTFFNVPKNTIVAITGWSSMCRSTGCTELFYGMSYAAYQITGNTVLQVEG